jgi:hypothetical protein
MASNPKTTREKIMNVLNIKHEKIETLSDMESKYFSLVWLARKYKVSDADGNLITTPEMLMADSDIGLATAEGIVLKQFALLEAYPDEVKALISDDDGDWAHGFNSGMLAAIRFFRTAEEESLQDALDEFPSLDS